MTASRNASFDALRALAIFVVFACHALPAPESSGLWFAAVNFGQRGVDLFFVLSGYLIGTIALREFFDTGRIQLGRFWSRRWLRTLPAYYAVLALYGLKQFVPSARAGLVDPLSYVVFAQSYVVGSLNDFAHSWSLAVEEHFYLALPLLLIAFGLLGSKARAHVVALLVALALAFVATRHFVASTGIEVYPKLSHWRTDGLLVGVILAALHLRSDRFSHSLQHHRGAWIGATLVLTAVAFVVHFMGSAYWEESAVAACTGAVVLGIGHNSLLESAGRLRIVRWLAFVSYSLYLIHPLVLGTLRVYVFHPDLGDPVGVAVFFVVGFTLSGVAAHLLYLFVEQPFMKYRDRRRSTEPTTPRSGSHVSIQSNS